MDVKRAECCHRHRTDQRTGCEQQKGVPPTDQVGGQGDEVDRHDGEQEADRGLCRQCGPDETLVRVLADRGGEHTRIGDDGGAPHQ